MNDEKFKILHIDDEDYFLGYFAMSYRAYFDITPVNNGTDALKKILTEKFDAVVTDYEMPDYNGLELLKIIREKIPDMPVIFYTAQGNESVAREVFIAGASDYFTKELNKFAHREIFINSIKSAIEKKKTEQALKYRYSFEQLIISLSRKFMNRSSELTDVTIHESLDIISRFEGIDHSFIFMQEENSDDFICTHEWREEGIKSTFLNRDNVNGKIFPWIEEQLSNNEIVCILGADYLPNDAVNEKSFLLREDIQSLLLIVLKYEERNIGIMGMSSRYPDKKWTDEFKNLIKIVADIITGALIRKKHEEELSRHHESLEDIVRERTTMLVDINRKLKQEIAWRVEAEEILKKSEEKYRRIFENIQDVYFEVSVNGIILELSPSINLISSYQREDLISTSAYKKFFNPSDRDKILKRIFKYGTLNDYEIIFKDRNNSPVYCSVNSRLVLDQNGKPEKFVGTVRNISNRKKAEKELKLYQEKLEELVEERTRQLLLANESLKKEIRENEKAKEVLKSNETKYKLLAMKLSESAATF